MINPPIFMIELYQEKFNHQSIADNHQHKSNCEWKGEAKFVHNV